MVALSGFLDWLDEAAAGLIRIAYLLAGVTAVAVYFGAGHLPPNVESVLNGILPWALSFAVETHTYISARRVRAAWQDKLMGVLKVNLAVLAGLLIFSAWNQLNYLYETWTPPQTALALPGWVAYAVRALVVPGAFMAAAFLAPLAQPVAAQIEAEARNVLADVFRIARKQRRQMLKDAQKDGRDMTGALVELVTDADLRHVISHAYNAIKPATEIAPYDGGPGSGVPLPPPQLPHPDEDEQEQPNRASETFPHLVPTRRRGGLTASALVKARKLSTEVARRAAAFAYLDANPASSANQLAKVLKCRRETAGELYAAWSIERRQKVANA